MPETELKFRREPAHQRREALIQATLSLIAEQGVRGATVRAIAKRAEVTQGMIRHHFSSKDDLVLSAYEYHMNRMTRMTAEGAEGPGLSAREQLAGFVTTGLAAPVMDTGSVTLWAGFLNMVRGNARMRRIHEETYYDFRNRLERLIATARAEAGYATTPAKLRQMAIACNAAMDGLWMEGGALPDAFEPDDLKNIGLTTISAITGLDLQDMETPS